MATHSIPTQKQKSLLSNMDLGFEFDVTWDDARKDVRTRTSN